MRKTLALFSLFVVFAVGFAQWKDKVALGTGGEPSLATDGKGNLFATAHLPSTLFISRDWGVTFPEKRGFPDSFCDMYVTAMPDGRVNLTYIINGITGLASWFSTDSGKTLTEGTGLKGPLDREWLAINPVNGEVYMDYSHGYIGGPKSSGVFLAASTNGGKSFEMRSRIDKEPEGSYPVDPYLSVSSTGKIYGLWATSTDYDTIDGFNFAVSSDGGKTFTGHQNIVRFNKNAGDTQERWMLGSIVASGKSTVFIVYPDYETLTVDGKTTRPLILHYRASKDAGKTFGPEHTLLSMKEIEASVRSFEAGKKVNTNVPYFAQTLSWASADPNGKIHVVWVDNRTGQAPVGNDYFGKWQVRYTSGSDLSRPFGPSEQVSGEVTCIRFPLDFISCAADAKYVYVMWSETPNLSKGWAFSGQLYMARRAIK